MFFRLTWQFPGGTDRRFELGLPVEPVTNVITSAAGSARELCAPDNLRRAFDYAKPWLPILADVAGVGFAGQLALQAALALTQRALGGESDDTERPAAAA